MARCQEIGQKEKLGLSVEEQRKGKNAPKGEYLLSFLQYTTGTLHVCRQAYQGICCLEIPNHTGNIFLVYIFTL